MFIDGSKTGPLSGVFERNWCPPTQYRSFDFIAFYYSIAFYEDFVCQYRCFTRPYRLGQKNTVASHEVQSPKSFLDVIKITLNPPFSSFRRIIQFEEWKFLGIVCTDLTLNSWLKNILFATHFLIKLYSQIKPHSFTTNNLGCDSLMR